MAPAGEGGTGQGPWAPAYGRRAAPTRQVPPLALFRSRNSGADLGHQEMAVSRQIHKQIHNHQDRPMKLGDLGGQVVRKAIGYME